MNKNDNTQTASWNLTPQEKRKYATKWLLPQKQCLTLLGVFILLAETLWWAVPYFSPSTPWTPKTCSSCRTILMLLPIEGSKRCVFILGAIREFAQPRRTNPRKQRCYLNVLLLLLLLLKCVLTVLTFTNILSILHTRQKTNTSSSETGACTGCWTPLVKSQTSQQKEDSNTNLSVSFVLQ